MKYLCIVHFDGAIFGAMTDQERRDLDRDSMAYDQDLMARGHLILAEALQSPASAALVKVRNGEMSVTDGPFAEAKEQMGGFIFIEARDMTEAVSIAAGIPLAKRGTIEVRAIFDVPSPD